VAGGALESFVEEAHSPDEFVMDEFEMEDDGKDDVWSIMNDIQSQPRVLRLEIENPRAMTEPEEGVIVARISWFQKKLHSHVLKVNTANSKRLIGSIDDPRERFLFNDVSYPEFIRVYDVRAEGFEKATCDLIKRILQENPSVSLYTEGAIAQTIDNFQRILKLMKTAPEDVASKVVDLLDGYKINQLLAAGMQKMSIEKAVNLSYRGLMAIRLLKSGKEFFNDLKTLRDLNSIHKFESGLKDDLHSKVDFAGHIPDRVRMARKKMVDFDL